MAISEFTDLLHQTITIAPWASRDGYGNATYGAAVAYKARVVGKQQLVKSLQGQDVTSQYTVYLLSNVAVDSRSLVTLPAGYTPSAPPVLAVGTYPDEDGIHHTTIFL